MLNGIGTVPAWQPRIATWGAGFTSLLCDQMHNGLIVRELPWRLARHRPVDVDIVPQVRLSRDLDAAYEWLIKPAAQEFLRIGALSHPDGGRLLDDLRERVPRAVCPPIAQHTIDDHLKTSTARPEATVATNCRPN